MDSLVGDAIKVETKQIDANGSSLVDLDRQVDLRGSGVDTERLALRVENGGAGKRKRLYSQFTWR